MLVIPRSKELISLILIHLIFSEILILQQKKFEKFGEKWVADVRYLWIIEKFLFCHSYFNIHYCLLCFSRLIDQ